MFCFRGADVYILFDRVQLISLGIFAYFNYNVPRERKWIFQLLIHGLRRLEYRGYDSAGLCSDGENGGKPELFKMVGNVDQLEGLLNSQTLLDPNLILNTHGCMAHTRWATHGTPTAVNCHPQTSDAMNEFVVVHNGIITNYQALKQMLVSVLT